MDKHTKRYMFERFGHDTESFGMDDMMDMIGRTEPGDEFNFISDAIQTEFKGIQRDYLQVKLWDRKYGR